MSSNLYADTTNLQWIRADTEDSSNRFITFECVFTPGSSAIACFINVSNIKQEIVTSATAYRVSNNYASNRTVELPSGIYIVNSFVIMEDHSIQPSYHGSINVEIIVPTIPSQSPSPPTEPTLTLGK